MGLHRISDLSNVGSLDICFCSLHIYYRTSFSREKEINLVNDTIVLNFSTIKNCRINVNHKCYILSMVY